VPPDDPAAFICIETVEAGPGSIRSWRAARPWKVASQDSAGRPSSQDPAAHFGGRLVREGDGEDPASCNTANRDAVDNRGGRRFGFAGTGERQGQGRRCAAALDCTLVRPATTGYDRGSAGAVHGDTSR
jgi:hypothetical protein